jgi:hypothetical protein
MANLVVSAREVLADDRLPDFPDVPEAETADEEATPATDEPKDEAPEPAPPAEAATRQLLDQLADDRISQLSEAITSVAQAVSPDESEKLIDAWSDFVEASMALKARLNAVSMSAIPSRQVEKKMKDALAPLLDEVRPFEPVT